MNSLLQTGLRVPEMRLIRALSAIALALMSLAPSLPVQAQPRTAPEHSRSVLDWLSRMHEASRQRAYTGTLVVSDGVAMAASRIWHVCDGTQQMERIETLTGAPRTTIRHNNDVITFVPEAKTAWVEKRESLGLFPDLLRTPNNAIPEFYGARVGQPERIAGYLSDVVDIVPRDTWRLGYRIWSEKKTGLVVKLQTLGERGAVLEQVAFSDLQLDAPVRMDKLKQLMADTKGYDVHRSTLKKTTPEAEGWRLREAVPGFQSMSCQIRESTDGGLGSGSAPPPLQWVFSDGLATVSLFVEPFDAQRHGAEKASQTGATQSLTRRIGAFWLTALGEVPPATLRRFAAALERTR
jgi:sigma-E factor negative regulatory protein RseB